MKVKKAKNAFLNVSSKIYQNKPINNIFNILSSRNFSFSFST